MFETPKLLDRNVHKDLKLSPVEGIRFAEKLTVVGLSYKELVPASKCFPVVFRGKEESGQASLPHAVLSIEKDKNAFVKEDGSWGADYLPLHIRRYPFILGSIQEKNQFAVMIDETAPHFSGEKGEPLFNEDGEPTKVLENVQNFLKAYNQDVDLTLQMVKEIEDSDILKPMNLKITKGNAGRNIRGFRVVDAKKLVTLEDKVLARWVKKGIIAMIYAHLFSINNFTAIAKLQGVESPVPETPES